MTDHRTLAAMNFVVACALVTGWALPSVGLAAVLVGLIAAVLVLAVVNVLKAAR